MKIFIAGRWKPAGSGATPQVINRRTDRAFDAVSAGGDADADAALAAASRLRKLEAHTR
jgi:acyl-CoA reductase-like NAD-dependent aldehyde dehydrogenase